MPTLTDNPVSLHVLKEHTIGVIRESGGFLFLQPISADVDGYDWKNGSVSAFAKDVRPATQADFDRLRLSSKGFFVTP